MRVVGLSLAQFFLFSATVLTIFANVGQLTNNVVARNIYLAGMRFHVPELRNLVNSPAMDKIVNSLNADAKNNYLAAEWGMYSHCLHSSANSKEIACSERGFGERFNPADGVALLAGGYNVPQTDLLDKIHIVHQWDDLSKGGMYTLFLGTVFTGVAWLIGFLALRPLIAFSVLLNFLAFALLLTGAAIWSFMIHKLKTSNNLTAIEYRYGNALWLMWASVFCTLVALPLQIVFTLPGRRKYAEEY